MFWSFVQIFLFCELGEILTSQYDKLNGIIFECEWYKFPIGTQKTLPIITMGFRIPVVISGYGNIRCTRRTFHNVMHIFDHFLSHLLKITNLLRINPISGYHRRIFILQCSSTDLNNLSILFPIQKIYIHGYIEMINIGSAQLRIHNQCPFTCLIKSAIKLREDISRKLNSFISSS